MPRRTLSIVVTTGATLLLLALTGCTAPEPAPTRTPTAAPVIQPTGDGTVRIGTLFAMTGDGAASGAAQVAGTELAAREIFQEGMVLGQPVQLIHRNLAGDVGAALADFTARGVDVVLWDAASAVPADVASSVTDSGLALLALADLVNGGTPLPADEAFTARLRSADPTLADTAGGAEGYDGVIVTALAATVAADDGSASIEAAWASVHGGRTVCLSWGECVAALADAQQIDFQGITGAHS